MAEAIPNSDALTEAEEFVGLAQFDFSTWGGQIFWLVVTFGILYFILSRFILPGIATGIAERGDRIADDLDAAARMQRDAETAQAEYEKSLTDARAKAHNISATTRASVEAEIASEVETAEADLSRQAAAAEARISGIRNDAMRNVGDIASETTAEILSKLAGIKPSAAALKSAVSKG